MDDDPHTFMNYRFFPYARFVNNKCPFCMYDGTGKSPVHVSCHIRKCFVNGLHEKHQKILMKRQQIILSKAKEINDK